MLVCFILMKPLALNFIIWLWLVADITLPLIGQLSLNCRALQLLSRTAHKAKGNYKTIDFFGLKIAAAENE